MEIGLNALIGVLAGSLGGLVVYQILSSRARRDSTPPALGADKLTEELVDLKASIRVIFYAAPLFALLLAAFGFKNLSELAEKLSGVDLVSRD